MFVISFEFHGVKVRKLLVSLKNKRNFTRCSVERKQVRGAREGQFFYGKVSKPFHSN